MSEISAVGLHGAVGLVVSAILFTIGVIGVLLRRNAIIVFMCVELMLNAVNISFVSFGDAMTDLGGQVSVFFVLVVAAAEVVIGLALVVAIMRRQPRATADDIAVMRG